MVDRGREPRLAQEALAKAGVERALGRDQLQRHRTVERDLRGKVDDAHAALAQEPLDPVPGEHRARGELRHGRRIRGLVRTNPWSRGQGALALGPCSHDLPDRKSTRLNSSHMSISYAVFCLKK